MEKFELKPALADLICKDTFYELVLAPNGETVLNLKIANMSPEEREIKIRPVIDLYVKECNDRGIKIPWINFYG